ncbi:efflux transporter, outer membrane factor (OMF) lipoprotein, NodT family [Ferrimonas sediminum]|uniref:Efflux transporter, outer membrane factor (OMF) lipoprotein, NodT family n=1 Tax=Ferrimonas sediminum TaxID=718193 RepID=A0A1G8RDT1_9GAMM|nr:efflux transporter outer membrane subunit [Ferrimonas sediminum]SDJ15167.1 efflux transporter, outer membrane factor (OMF) lipoprotein, NodT family [Ferrimonas sediminum]
MRNLIPLSLALLLSGCAVGPDYLGPDTSTGQPENWQTSAHTRSADVELGWWQQFNDPMLNQLVAQALTQNLNVLAAQERVKLADSYRQAVSATSLPQIGIGGGFIAGMLSEQGPVGGPLRNPSLGGQPLGIPLADRHFQASYLGVSAAWEPDLFGKTARLVEATQARADQVAIVADGTRMLVVSAVANNYLQLRSAQQQKQILLSQQQDLQALELRVASLYDSGLTSGIEPAQIRAQQAQLQAALPQFDSVIDAHSRRLAILTGQPSSALLTSLATPQPLPQVNGVIPVGLPSELLQRRPDIRFAERQMKVANAELGVAIANQYPSFYLTGAPGVAASDFGDLFASGSSAWSFGAGVNWSLFDGGLRDALEAVAQSQVDIAALEYQRTLLTAFGEVETLLNAYGNSQAHLQSLSRAQAQIGAAVTRTDALADSGLASGIDRLQARGARHQADLQLLQAQTRHAQLVVTLYKSLGGRWPQVD